MTLSAASHFHQGLWLKIEWRGPRSRVSHVDALGHQAPALPSPPGRRGAGRQGGEALGGPLAGPSVELHPLQGSRRQSWGPGASLDSPIRWTQRRHSETCGGIVWLLAFLFGVLTQGTVTQKRSERGGSQGPWLQAAPLPTLVHPRS